MKHVVMFSGGVCSWATAKRVAAQYGVADLVLLFADTKIEDADTYRFLDAAAANVGAELVKVADGRNPFRVFRDERFLGNSLADPCSKILKRQVLDRWCKASLDPADTIRYFGIHWSESDRFDAIQARLGATWTCRAPMCEPPFMGAQAMHDWAAAEGLPKQRLYQIGHPHANCGGGCCKMGQGGWTRNYYLNRPVFDLWRDEEQAIRAELGKDVAMMLDRSGGQKRPLTLAELQRRIESGAQIDLLDMGGCGCFAGSLEAA